MQLFCKFTLSTNAQTTRKHSRNSQLEINQNAFFALSLVSTTQTGIIPSSAYFHVISFFHPLPFHLVTFVGRTSFRRGNKKGINLFVLLLFVSQNAPFLATTGLLPSKFPCYLFICVSKHKFLRCFLRREVFLSRYKYFLCDTGHNTRGLKEIQRLWSLNNNKTVKLFGNATLINLSGILSPFFHCCWFSCRWEE
jgi:hypothetical protein